MVEYESPVHEEKQQCSSAGFITFMLGLISGTFSALLCKMAYDTKSIGISTDEVKPFTKPIMMLTLMFFGMVPAIFFWGIQQYFTVPEKKDKVPFKTFVILIIPSVCDLLCTLLLLIAQLYITASLWQMMRGSIIIITALMKRFALNHRLKFHMWLGVGFITLAMLLVASTSFFSPVPDGSNAAPGIEGKDPRIGILLVFVGCLAQGVQYVFEEKVMGEDNAPPLVVIGCEGLWGTFLSLLVVYPIAYIMPGSDNGSFEDPFDAYAMIRNSKSLKVLIIAFVITVTMYNCAAVYVTKYLSAIWHAILDNFRPISIWALDLAIFYVFLPGQGFGEPWIVGSWLQLGGLVILLFGTAVYNGSVWTFDGAEYSLLSSNDRPDDQIVKTVPAVIVHPAVARSPYTSRQLSSTSSNSMKTEQSNYGAVDKRGSNEV